MKSLAKPSFSIGDKVRKINGAQSGVIIGEYQDSPEGSESKTCGYVVKFPGLTASSKQLLTADSIELDVEAITLELDERRIIRAISDEISQAIGDKWSDWAQWPGSNSLAKAALRAMLDIARAQANEKTVRE